MVEGDPTDQVATGTHRGAPLRNGDPRRLGRYELLAVLGEGGMGRVYLGRADNGRQVAVKVIRREIANDADFRRRFRNEVSRARQVPPFSTAEVVDADPDHDPPYLVVEYVDGPSLADVVAREGPLTLANLHGIAVGVAAALTAIHDAGVVHRDLKPANVLLARGSPKVIDFGIAKPAVNPTGVTDGVLGTIPYMAPERFYPQERANVTPATDIFAWGAIVAFAATGRSPFSAESTGAAIGRILHGTPDLAGLAQPLRGLVEQALASDPDQRPTARQLLDRLTAAQAPSYDEPSSAPQPPPGGPTLSGPRPRRLYQHRRLAYTSTAVLLLAALATLLGPTVIDRVAARENPAQPVGAPGTRPSSVPATGAPNQSTPPTSPSTTPAGEPPQQPAETSRPTSSASRDPACAGVETLVVDTQGDLLPDGYCLTVGSILRVENAGPGEASAEPRDSVICHYEASVHECRLVRAGMVTFTLATREPPISFRLWIVK